MIYYFVACFGSSYQWYFVGNIYNFEHCQEKMYTLGIHSRSELNEAKSVVVSNKLNLGTGSLSSLWWITAARACACGRAMRCTGQRTSVQTCDWSNQVCDMQHSFSRRTGFRVKLGLIPLRKTQSRGAASYSAWGVATTGAWTRARRVGRSEVLVGHSLWRSHCRWRG